MYNRQPAVGHLGLHDLPLVSEDERIPGYTIAWSIWTGGGPEHHRRAHMRSEEKCTECGKNSYLLLHSKPV